MSTSKKVLVKDINIVELFADYKTGSKEKRDFAAEMIVKKYEKYIYSLMHKKFPSFATEHGTELFHAGVCGMFQAINGYNPEYSFTTYSKYFILNEMLQEVNFLQGISSMHYSRIHKKVVNAVNELERENRSATEETISDITGLKKEQIKDELQSMNHHNYVYMDHMEDYDGLNISSALKTPEDIASKNETTKMIADAIMDLPELEKQIIIQHFVHQIKLTEIARRCNKSLSTIKKYYQLGLKEIKSKLD